MRTHKRNRPASSASQNASAERTEPDPVPQRVPTHRVGERRRRAERPSSRRPSSADRSSSRRFASLFSRLLAFALVTLLLMAAGGLLFAEPGDSITKSSPFPLADAAPSAETFDPGRFAFEMGVVFLLILMNAFFSLAEYALITVRKTRIRQLVEEGNRNALLVEQVLANSTRLQATIQTGLTLVATLSSAIAATSAVTPLTHWLMRFGGVIAHSAGTLAFLLVVLPVTVLSLVIGEVAPKSLALRHPERFALIAVHPIRWLQWLLTPAVTVLTFLSNLVVRPFGGTASFVPHAYNEEEFKMLVEASEEQGVIEADATEMIHSILDFGDTVVRKVMTPRIEMTAFDVAAPLSDLVKRIVESGHSRLPVYEGDLDNIVGIVHAKDLLALPTDTSRDNKPIRDVMRKPYFIPEIKKVDELLNEFRRSKQQLAIVRDEYGVTSGLVTIEDLLEEIVGDIQDEYDREEPQVQVVDGNTSILDGMMGLHDVNDRMGLELPEDEADTIGGFVFNLLGHQAVQGESVSWDGVLFTVEATDGRRITKVRLTRLPQKPAAGDGKLAADGSRTAAATADPPVDEEKSANVRTYRIETAGVETSPGART